MPKTPILTVTLPWGGKLMRATWRRYTHAVVYVGGNQSARALAWCGSLALAETQLKYWGSTPRLRWHVPGATEGGGELRIVEVDKVAAGRVCACCGACEGEKHHDAEYAHLVVVLYQSRARQRLECMVCREGLSKASS